MDYVLTLILPHSQPTLNLILSPDPEQSGLLKGGGGREGWNMWVILTSLSTNFKLDPESRSRSRTVRPTKGGGGGGREGWNMWVILTSLSTNFKPESSPEPLQRTSSCAEIKQKNV